MHASPQWKSRNRRNPPKNTETQLATETDVSAVLDALSHVMGEELSEGRQVHLDGIGYFYPTLKSEKGITRETDRKNEKVRLKGIISVPTVR